MRRFVDGPGATGVHRQGFLGDLSEGMRHNYQGAENRSILPRRTESCMARRIIGKEDSS
jgi:hypothetical protein